MPLIINTTRLEKLALFGNLNQTITYFSLMKALTLISFVILSLSTYAQRSISEIRDQYALGQYDTCKVWIDHLSEQEFIGCDFMLKGDIYQKLGLFEEAEIYYNLASVNDCQSLQLDLNRGINQYNMGNYSTSQHLIQQYVLDNPVDHLGIYWLGVTYYMQGKMSKALEEIEICYELNENFAPAYFLEGAIYASRKLYSAAYDAFQMAHVKDNTLQQALFEGGIVLLEMQRYADAKATFQTLAVEQTDFQAQAYFYAGEACYYLRESDKACEYWNVAKTMGDHDASVNVTRFCAKGKKPKRKPKAAYLQF
jgi:tetratricopeptide (TPR) repeat protein